MPRTLTLVVVPALLTLMSATAGADDRNVYRWTDAEGNVHYSDRPQSEEATPTGITSKATDPARVADARAKLIGPAPDSPTGTADGASADADASADAEEDPSDRAARFAENCRRAQSALQSIVNARRLYIPTDDGSRRYLDQDETAARRAKAQADVQEWCR